MSAEWELNNIGYRLGLFESNTEEADLEIPKLLKELKAKQNEYFKL